MVLALGIFWATWSLGLSGHDIECAACIIRASRDDFVVLLISQSDEGTSEMRLITRLVSCSRKHPEQDSGGHLTPPATFRILHAFIPSITAEECV